MARARAMTGSEKLDAAVSEALIEWPNALVEFVGPDGITHVLGFDVLVSEEINYDIHYEIGH